MNPPGRGICASKPCSQSLPLSLGLLGPKLLDLRAVLRLLLVCCQLGACKETLLLRVLQLQAELHGVDPVLKVILEAVHSRKPGQAPAHAVALWSAEL